MIFFYYFFPSNQIFCLALPLKTIKFRYDLSLMFLYTITSIIKIISFTQHKQKKIVYRIFWNILIRNNQCLNSDKEVEEAGFYFIDTIFFWIWHLSFKTFIKHFISSEKKITKHKHFSSRHSFSFTWLGK